MINIKFHGLTGKALVKWLMVAPIVITLIMVLNNILQTIWNYLWA